MLHYRADQQETTVSGVLARELDGIASVIGESTNPRMSISIADRGRLSEYMSDNRDLSAFYLTQFEYPDRILLFKDEVAIEPEIDESQQLMILREDQLGIDVVASTREELFQGLVNEIEILWRNYAMAPDAELSPAARRLKRRLLDAIEERVIAAR
jgi:hypothetical protein